MEVHVSAPKLASAAFTLIFLMSDFTGGCMRKVEPVHKRDVTVVANQTTTLNPISMLNCTSSEIFYKKCRKGECVASYNSRDNSTRSYCECESGYSGKYCERRRKRPPVTGSVYAVVGVVVVVVIIVLIGLAVIVKIRYQRKRRHQMAESDSSPHTDGANNMDGVPEQSGSRYGAYSSSQNGEQNHEQQVELLSMNEGDKGRTT